MARMIPPHPPFGTPAGESQVFNRLRADANTRDWIAFHSLGLREHTTRLEGEADFIVIVPRKGVLCIEVKGCDVARRDGLWTYPYGTSPIGPFRQAADASHSLRRYVDARDRTLSRLLYYSAVIFTAVDFDEASPEWHPWQVVGRTALLRNPISRLVDAILDRAHAHSRARSGPGGWYSTETSRPTARQSQRLAQLLRPDFEYVDSGRGAIELGETAVTRFTEEQFDALDHLEENRFVVFKGPPGTGKTFLAIEAAKRSVSRGKSTALVCFNKLLGEWMKRETASISEDARRRGVRFWAGTLHQLMLQVARIQVPSVAGSGFWDETLPESAIGQLLNSNDDSAAFEGVLVDEAQDVLKDPFLDFLDLVIRGGLAAGRWSMFGDFARQAIYACGTVDQGLESLRQRAGMPELISHPLRVNCRNALRIAETVSITSALSPGYSRVLHDSAASDVEPFFYRNEEHQLQALAASIRQLRRTFRPDEIVVLSMRSDAESAAARLASAPDEPTLRPYRESDHREGEVRFATVHAFKGLEAPAVVLTDIEQIESDHARSLLYVGMSRPRFMLHMLMNERLRASYDSMLDAGLRTSLRGTR